jgi:hypothetical protein
MSRQHCQTNSHLRAVQLGLICKTEVHQAMSICENSKEEALDVRNIYHKVKKYLALNFDIKNEARFT